MQAIGTEQQGRKLVEFAPDEMRNADELPDERLRSAMAVLTRLSDHAARHPGQPWREFACEVDDDETQDILCLWVCGLVRVATEFDNATQKPVRCLARPK
jgi:hypothetical protein